MKLRTTQVPIGSVSNPDSRAIPIRPTDQAYRFRPSNAGSSLFSHVYQTFAPRRGGEVETKADAKKQLQSYMSIQTGFLFEKALIETGILPTLFEGYTEVESQVKLGDEEVGGTCDFILFSADMTKALLLDAKASKKQRKREMETLIKNDDRNYQTQIALYRMMLEVEYPGTEVDVGWVMWSSTSHQLFTFVNVLSNDKLDYLADRALRRREKYEDVLDLVKRGNLEQAATLAVTWESPLEELDINQWGYLTGTSPIHWHQDRNLMFDEEGFPLDKQILIELLLSKLTEYKQNEV